MTLENLIAGIGAWLARLRGDRQFDPLDTHVLRDVGLHGCVHAPKTRFNPWRDLR